MKTIKQWLKEGLSKEDYRIAKVYKDNYNPFISWHVLVNSFKEAMDDGFCWRDLNKDYWQKIYDNNGTLKVIAKDVVGIPGAGGHNPSSKLVVTGMSLDMIVESVREDLLRRSQVGIEKYGTTLERTDIDENGWKSHLYEELLDAACYLKRLMVEQNGKK